MGLLTILFAASAISFAAAQRPQGGFSEPKEPDQELRLLLQYAGAREHIATKLQEQGLNIAFTEFTPISYRTQRVKGTNYLVRVRISEAHLVDSLINLPLPGQNAAPTVLTAQLVEAATGPGGLSEPKEPDQELRLLLQYAHARHEIAKKLQEQNWNIALTEFTPISYRTQRVKGTNYLVRIRINEVHLVDSEIHLPLPGQNTPPRVLSVQLVQASEPLAVAGPGGISKEKVPDTELRLVLEMSDSPAALEKHLQREGWNGVFTEFTPLNYRTQTVKGTIYHVRARIGEGQAVDAKIHAPLLDEDAMPSVKDVKLAPEDVTPGLQV